jgi:hypothetical protein
VERKEVMARRRSTLRRRYGHAAKFGPIVRVVITEIDSGRRKSTRWVLRAYDDQGHLRTGIAEPTTDRAYVERKAAEWYPGIPVEYQKRVQS